MTPERAPTSRRRPSRVELERAAPFLEWGEMMRYLKREFRQGDHVSVLGPTGTGKTHLALEVAEIRTYVLVIACKQRDPLIEETLERGYYLIPTTSLKKGVEYLDGRPRHPRIVYWPRLPDRIASRLPDAERIRARSRVQKPLIQAALGFVDLDGHWCVVLDEGTWVYRDLGLGQDIDAALNQWRTNRASLVILGQRPAWMGRYVLSMPTHVFLFNTGNYEDAKSLGEITGSNVQLVRAIVPRLDRQRHEVLYVNSGNGEMFRTIARPR